MRLKQQQKKTQNQFPTPQIKALIRRCESADPLYKNLKIIKFQDLFWLNNWLLMGQLKQNNKLAATFPGFADIIERTAATQEV